MLLKLVIFFDINADGVKDLMEWIGPNDGLLIFFKNDKYTEEVDGFNLMSNAFGFENGFEKLFEMFDINKDRVIDKTEMEGLYVWQDKNQDGKVQENEILNSKDINLTRINLNYNSKMMSTATMNGKTTIVWDWYPATLDVKFSK